MTHLSDKAMIRVLDIHITGKARMTFMEIDDMKQETKTTVKETTPEPKAKKAAPKKAKKERRAYSRFDADQKADIIRRYKAGEGPKAISESLGCSRSLITHIIHDAGAVEGRTGAHLNKGREKAPAQEPIPEPAQETVTDSVETEDERYTRLRKERIEWQKNHPNKW